MSSAEFDVLPDKNAGHTDSFDDGENSEDINILH